MSSTSHIQSRILATPKAGSSAAEYEDAAAVRADVWPVRAAVADGATESAFAGRWANTLVKGAMEIAATPEAVAAALPDWQDAWGDALPDENDVASWYTSMKVEEGAFATLLGVELYASGRWRAVSVGDSTLFHLHDPTRSEEWPPADQSDVTSRPALVPSRAARKSPVPDGIRSTTGTWQSGDTFLLATDAVSEWLHRADPVVARDWTASAFQEAVEAARDGGRLRNDDATLLVLSIEE